MASDQQIEVWVSPEGALTIKAAGYTGDSCEEATRFLESELGTVGHKQRTSDWYRRATNKNQNQQPQST